MPPFRGFAMSRPKPAILLSRIDPKTFKAEQVLQATAIYAVFYEGQPINLRSLLTSTVAIDTKARCPKYKKVSFSNPGHAHNLKDKLNALFKTDQFIVVRLSDGEPITEDDE